MNFFDDFFDVLDLLEPLIDATVDMIDEKITKSTDAKEKDILKNTTTYVYSGPSYIQDVIDGRTNAVESWKNGNTGGIQYPKMIETINKEIYKKEHKEEVLAEESCFSKSKKKLSKKLLKLRIRINEWLYS